MTDPNAEEAGFAGASAALGSIQAENSWIQQQIDGGGLSMEPSAADEAAKVYEREADEVEKLITKADGLQQVPGLGDYPSGRQLAAKFGQKARNGTNGAADLLGQLRDELRRKADLFRQAKQKYQATDDQVAQDVRRSAQ
ncbi:MULTISPECIES: hypothetical protein [unclassified Actinopolyspora]|uniref:hypothetical protein n=1 Tax=unclassified Actinopolyspora TaxID=2639451 RepID=UPI0013F5A30D|nr:MULTISPECIES: hypothetical protein [unclassified Actinopolyspora]NHD18950.1 hypothetical protein [Actinopolyspora sp. BKK2]NHE77373.1 hypothetical protein [Actinopolyspora sp. BKK1]